MKAIKSKVYFQTWVIAWNESDKQVNGRIKGGLFFHSKKKAQDYIKNSI